VPVITDVAGVVGGRELGEPGRSDAISSYANSTLKNGSSVEWVSDMTVAASTETEKDPLPFEHAGANFLCSNVVDRLPLKIGSWPKMLYSHRRCFVLVTSTRDLPLQHSIDMIHHIHVGRIAHHEVVSSKACKALIAGRVMSLRPNFGSVEPC